MQVNLTEDEILYLRKILLKQKYKEEQINHLYLNKSILKSIGLDAELFSRFTMWQLAEGYHIKGDFQFWNKIFLTDA